MPKILLAFSKLWKLAGNLRDLKNILKTVHGNNSVGSDPTSIATKCNGRRKKASKRHWQIIK